MSVNRSLTIGIKEKAKHVRIIGTATQFQGSTPANITLQVKLYGITAKSYAWYKGASAVVGTNPNFVIANNQIATVETYKVVVTAIDGQVYEDTLSVTKVQNGATGKSGKIIVQREWIVGDVYRNNSELIDYIYHRVSDSWWKLRVGFDNVTAAINPGSQFEKVTSSDELALTNIVTENANVAGFIFKNGVQVSQYPSPDNPNLMLDGKTGKLVAKDVDIRGGLFGGFNIESNKITSQDNQFEINSNNGTITYKDPTGKILWSINKDGIVFTERKPETFTKKSYRRVEGNANSTFLQLLGQMTSSGYISVREAVQIKDITKVDEDLVNRKELHTGRVKIGLVREMNEIHGGGGIQVDPETRPPNGFAYGDFLYYPSGYIYNAGINEASSQNNKYNNKLFNNDNLLSGELALSDGWWVSEVLHEGVITYVSENYSILHSDIRNAPHKNFKVSIEFLYYSNGELVKTVKGDNMYDLLEGYHSEAILGDTPDTWWKFY